MTVANPEPCIMLYIQPNIQINWLVAAIIQPPTNYIMILLRTVTIKWSTQTWGKNSTLYSMSHFNKFAFNTVIMGTQQTSFGKWCINIKNHVLSQKCDLQYILDYKHFSFSNIYSSPTSQLVQNSSQIKCDMMWNLLIHHTTSSVHITICW